MDFADHVIDRHLRHAVGSGGQREGFHVTDTCDSGRESNEHWVRGKFQQWPCGLEEDDCADDVDFKVIADFADGRYCCGAVVV